MTKTDGQPKDNTRVTVRITNAAVADEFHRQAREAGKRPSPFAAQLIEKALTQSDDDNYQQDMLRDELEELRNSVGALRELGKQLTSNSESSDDVLAELAALRNELGELKDSVKVLEDLPENLSDHQETPPELLTTLGDIRTDVAHIAELPHVFRKLREDLATSVNVLLVHAGQLKRSEAEEWVATRLMVE